MVCLCLREFRRTLKRNFAFGEFLSAQHKDPAVWVRLMDLASLFRGNSTTEATYWIGRHVRSVDYGIVPSRQKQVHFQRYLGQRLEPLKALFDLPEHGLHIESQSPAGCSWVIIDMVIVDLLDNIYRLFYRLIYTFVEYTPPSNE